MTQYYLPDITGTNPSYLQFNIPKLAAQIPGKIFFENSPVFATSLRLVKTDGTAYVLLKDIDYQISPDDIDQLGMSRAFMENPNFAGQLLQSVTLIKSDLLKQVIAASYQEFYLTLPNRSFDDGEPIELTPDFFKDLQVGLADVRQQVARVNSPVAPVTATPKLLPFDINKELPGNVISNEAITVNTVAGAKVIRLSQGAFFADSLVLTSNGVPLSKTKDYLPVQFSKLNGKSTNVGGIYEYILVNGVFAGKILGTYHAVGGEVQPSDITAVFDLMMGIRDFLNTSIFVTSDTVVETPAFRAVTARLNQVENKVRSLLSGPPTYGDATANTTVVRPLSTTDAKCHWWTIANLYQVQGSEDIVLADRFKARVFLPAAKIAFTFSVDVNLYQSRNVASFTTESLVFDPGYTLFGDVTVNAPVYPMLRLVWNQTGQAFSGVSLQIGLPLPNLSDQMVVEDLSTTESCWLLDKTGQNISGVTIINPALPSDNGFTLPDGLSIWSSASASSHSQIYVPGYDQGYLMYSGATVTLAAIANQNNNGNLFNCVLPTYFPISEIQSIIVTIASPTTAMGYDVTVPLPNPISSNGGKTGRVAFADSLNELMSLNVALAQDINGVITIGLNVSDIALATGTQSTSSMTDVIRYVRAVV